MQIKGIIFDIGGVLLDDPQFSTFWQGKAESKKLRDDFGTGKLTIADLIDQGSKLLNLTPKEFTKQYNSAYSGMNANKEVCKIYNQIKIDKYIFSDTNPIHFKFCTEKYSEIFNQAKKVFLSHETGFRKDDQDSYKHLLANIPYHPEELIFIDNKPEYIENAQKFGIKGILYSNEIDLFSIINQILIGETNMVKH